MWRILERAPVWLLVGVALCQIALAYSDGLLAWKGGGFGMFSRADGVELREVRARTRAGVPIEVPATVFREERSARIHPSERNLQTFARALERELGDSGQAVEVHVVEVWRTELAGDPLRPSKRLLARTTGPQP
jgi:hypothetical protein